MTISRRNFLAGAMAAGLAAGAWPRLGRADAPDPEKTAVELMTPECQRAIDAGLKFLASRQHDDGAFGSAGFSRDVAIGALAGLAFMAGGSTPNRGPYGREVARCAKHILDSTEESGLIIVRDASSPPMYGQGFATLFLAETYGMLPDGQIRPKLAKAVKLIVSSQNREGGWRYQPQPSDADISVTVCQVMALRAARNAGLYVPNETIDRCIDYVKRSQNGDGGFRYMLQGGPSAFPRSAAGLVALYSAGVYDSPEISRGLNYLMQFVPRPGQFSEYYYYGHYYAAQAMWHAGGEYWARWFPAIRDKLIGLQTQPTGCWDDPYSQEYGTAMACLILQVPNNLLPIFQR